MARSDSSTVLPHAVVLAYGPASATGAAIRHVRTIIGNDGTVSVVAPTRDSLPLLDKLPADTIAVDGFGVAALREIASRFEDEMILLVHDDVSIGRRGVETLVEAANRHRRPAVPWMNDPRIVHEFDVKRPKHVGDLDRLAGRLSETPTDGAISFACIVATGLQLASPIDRLIHIPAVRLEHIPAVVGATAAHHRRQCLEGLSRSGRAEDRPLLVANLIVRDETDNITECIESVLPLVDRVEVVDTGSVDNTAELAAAAGAHVTHAAWRDHFGWARNQALDQSRDAWFVLWIDADERLTAVDPAYMRRLLATIAGDVEGVSLQVNNRDDNDQITSSFYAPRILSTDGTHFEGAVHEYVVNEDGSSLSVVESQSVKLDHYGYHGTVVDEKEKYVRNLDLAKRQYEGEPTPKSAYEYARSLGMGGEDPKLAVKLFEIAKDGELDDAGLAHVLASLAHAKIGVADYEGSAQDARRALDLVPSDDLAGAALATAATEIGDYAAVASIETAQSNGPRPVFELETNRVLIDSYVGAALIRLGRPGEALARLEPHLGHSDAISWTTITEAATSTDDPFATLAPFARADRSGTLVLAAAASCSPTVTARLALERADAASPPPDTISTGLLAAAIAGDRSLLASLIEHRAALPTELAKLVADRLKARGFEKFSALLNPAVPTTRVGVDRAEAIDILTPQGSTVFDVRVDDLDAVSGRRFDVVVGGPLDDRDLLRRFRQVIDPAGVLIVWEPEASAPASVLHIGSPASSAPSRSNSTLGVDLVDAGFRPISIGEVTVARPELDEDLLAAAIESEQADAAATHVDIGVITLGNPPDETLMWLRAVVPGRLRIRHLASVMDLAEVNGVDVTDVERVLVLPSSVVPGNDWMARLLASPGTCGVGVTAADGSVLHAGSSSSGAPIGAGSRDLDHALFASDRSDVALLAPFICDASDLTTAPQGRHLGGVFARSTDVAPASFDAPAQLIDMITNPMMMVLTEAPAALSDELRRAFDDALQSCEGRTPVIVCHDDLDHDEATRLAAGTNFVFAGRDAQVAAIAASFEPTTVLYFGSAAFDEYHGAAAAGAPRAAHVAVGYQSVVTDLADAYVDAGEVRDAVSSVQAPPPPEPVVAPIPPPRSRRSGVVSVVIPVWNNWEFTDACLASLDAHTEAPLEIVVVDNGSTDGTAAALRVRDDIMVITNDSNRGFPAAVNQGVAAASGEFVCILNNDTVVTEGWLAEMLSALEVAGTGMVGPRSNQISGLQEVSNAPALSGRGAAERWARRFSAGRQGGSWLTNRLVGFCLVARRTLFEEVGGFDEGFGIGNYEDDELSARVLASGRTLRVADGSVVLHHGGATFSAQGLDHGALMAKAGRHFGGRLANPSGLLTAVVLSDADPRGAVATARSAMAIADRVRIVERAGHAVTEVETGALQAMGVELLQLDWQQPEGAARSLMEIDDHLVLICEAGETLDVPDWATARIALEQSTPGPMEVRTSSGFEVRFDRPEPDAISRFGSSSDVRITELQLRS